jgi:hypothetical protein
MANPDPQFPTAPGCRGQWVARGTAPADTAQDEALVKRFGASIVVPRGDAAIRGPYDAAPGGVDGLSDAAVPC